MHFQNGEVNFYGKPVDKVIFTGIEEPDATNLDVLVCKIGKKITSMI